MGRGVGDFRPPPMALAAVEGNRTSFVLPNVRAKPGPTDGCLAGAADDGHAKPRRPSIRPLGLGA
jgi:hypothetical protein